MKDAVWRVRIGTEHAASHSPPPPVNELHYCPQESERELDGRIVSRSVGWKNICRQGNRRKQDREFQILKHDQPRVLLKLRWARVRGRLIRRRENGLFVSRK